MKKRYCFYFVIFLISTGLVGCEKNKEDGKPIKVSWGGPKNISMTPIIAEKNGYFKEEGLNIETKYLQTGHGRRAF